ncbi:MAG: nucleotidyltransferase family protein [Pseudomonadota bacterium]
MRPYTHISLGTQQALEWLWAHPAHLKLVPHAFSVAEAAGEQLHADLLKKSKQLRTSFLARAMLLDAANTELLAAMAEAGIKAIPMKGPVLAQRLYGGLHHRPFVDLDILVQPHQLDHARALILDAGFQDVSRNPRQFHLEFSRTNRSGSHVYVELHRRLIGYAIGGDHLAFGIAGSKGFSEWCWERAAPANDYWQMAEGDELLYLCLHLAKHLITERKLASSGLACSSLLLARDIQLALAQWNFDPNEFLATVERFHLTVPVGMALAFTFRWFECESTTLHELASQLTSRQSARFLDWADDIGTKSKKSEIQVNNRLRMVLEAFAMADRWSDKLKILPMVAGEYFNRKHSRPYGATRAR